MPAYRNAVEIDVWPVSKLIDAASADPAGNSRVTIPEYQRRLVWSKAKRKELITSIKQGYPFGSILLYEHIAANDGKKHFNLIDGLQRTQALKSYVEHQNGYFERADLEDEFVDEVATHLGKHSDDYKDRIRKTVVEWVKGRKTYEAQAGWRTDSLIQALIDDVLRYDESSSLYKDVFFELTQNWEMTTCLGKFLDDVSGEVKLVLDSKVPVLVYSGPSSELPKVFELLNSRGTVLSRYEIYAARWIGYRQQIMNQEVIDAIWRKFETLEDEGFTLDVSEDATDDETRRTRQYSLFDYLFGFGQFLSDKFPRLFKPVKDDRPSSCGFNVVTACVGLHVSEMADLPRRIANYDMTEFEGCLLESVRFVDNLLMPILSARRFKSRPPAIYHSELMIVAMIASAFQVRYGLQDLSDNTDWKVDRKKLKHQLPMFYLYEVLHDDWRGSGDSKLFDTVKTLRYLQSAPPNQERWQQVFDDWYFATQIDYVHGKDAKRHIRDSRSEYLLLKFIYSRKLEKADTCHVEHIVPIANLHARMDNDEEWPVNSIGNMALLPKAGEFKDNYLTFDDMLRAKLNHGEISLQEFEIRLEEYEQQLLCPPEYLPKGDGRDAFEDFLLRRFDLLKAEFIRVWSDHIPRDPPA